MQEEEIKIKLDKSSEGEKEFKKEFKPASTSRNEPFQKNSEIFGLEDKKLKNLISIAKDVNFYSYNFIG